MLILHKLFTSPTFAKRSSEDWWKLHDIKWSTETQRVIEALLHMVPAGISGFEIEP